MLVFERWNQLLACMCIECRTVFFMEHFCLFSFHATFYVLLVWWSKCNNCCYTRQSATSGKLVVCKERTCYLVTCLMSRLHNCNFVHLKLTSIFSGVIFMTQYSTTTSWLLLPVGEWIVRQYNIMRHYIKYLFIENNMVQFVWSLFV